MFIDGPFLPGALPLTPHAHEAIQRIAQVIFSPRVPATLLPVQLAFVWHNKYTDLAELKNLVAT
jgi:hypothetical protein